MLGAARERAARMSPDEAPLIAIVLRSSSSRDATGSIAIACIVSAALAAPALASSGQLLTTLQTEEVEPLLIAAAGPDGGAPTGAAARETKALYAEIAH